MASDTNQLCLRVLVADDSAANRMLIQAFLSRLGCESVLADNGRTAVELFSAQQPDVVLMDLMMPEMDGFEAIRLIRKQTADRWVPILILSALSSEGDMVEGLDAGADDYLVKPLTFPVFAARFRALKRLVGMQNRLVDAIQQMEGISDEVVEGLITSDERGRILSANRAACEVFGYTREEFLELGVSDLMPQRYRRLHDAQMHEVIQNGGMLSLRRMRQLMGVRKNGESFPLEIGVSDLKMPDRRIFIAVVRDISEQRRIQQQLADNAARLQRYHDEVESERELAMSIMERQIRTDWLNDPSISHAVTPAQQFSGDVVVAARSPQGRLYAMLADATGHGLVAALSGLPAVSAFYRLVQRNAPLAALVGEINTQLNVTLPAGHFLAASFVCMDQATRRCELWIGGVPAVLLLDAAGNVIHRFLSTQLPLGIVASSADSCQSQVFDCPAGSQLVLSSDGVTEAEDVFGEPFGMERLERSLASASPAARVSALLADWHRHLAGKQAQDDVSVLILSCDPA
ncbi:MAG: SpoIIE family protein phosphatase [Zoogloea sp.]|nr:SpoIIE family protein phosphatase [Zoogloea sp.]